MSAWQIFLTFGVSIVTIVGAIIAGYWKIVDKFDEKIKNSDTAAQEREKARAQIEAEARKDVADKLREADRLAQKREELASQERIDLSKKLEGYIGHLANIAASLESYKDVKDMCFSRFNELEEATTALRKELSETNNRLNGHITDTNRHNSH